MTKLYDQFFFGIVPGDENDDYDDYCSESSESSESSEEYGDYSDDFFDEEFEGDLSDLYD